MNTLSENDQHTAETRPNLVAVGTIVWLSSELMFFAALFAMYFTVRQVSGPERFQPRRSGSLLQFNKWGMREWFALTFLMGAFFIGGQVYEYAHLVIEGITLSGSAYGSVFYITTGFHGMHVTGGLIAFLFVLIRASYAKKYGHDQATTAIVVSYYWHFVDVVWIALFASIYLIK